MGIDQQQMLPIVCTNQGEPDHRALLQVKRTVQLFRQGVMNGLVQVPAIQFLSGEYEVAGPVDRLERAVLIHTKHRAECRVVVDDMDHGSSNVCFIQWPGNFDRKGGVILGRIA